MTDPTELDARAWENIAKLWQEVAHVPASDPDGALEALWRGAQDLLEFDACYAVLASRTPRTRRAHKRGYVNGWLFAEFFYGPGNWKQVFEASFDGTEWHEMISRDPWLVHLVDTAGEHRTILRNDIFSDEQWEEYVRTSPTGSIGTRDRLTSVYHLDDQTEAYLGFLYQGDRRFGELDRKIAHQANVGLGPLLWQRLALSYGLLDGQEFLAPREREAFLALLRGGSRGEIAAALGVTEGTAQQYVNNLHTKLGVSGRGNLLALWLDPVSVE